MSRKKKSVQTANGKQPPIEPSNGKKKSLKPAYQLLPGEQSDIRKEAAVVVPDSEEWLDTPHAMLGGSKPRELLGTEYERFVRDILRMIKYGIST